MSNFLKRIPGQVHDSLDEMVKFVEVLLIIGVLIYIGLKINNSIPYIIAAYLGFLLLLTLLRNLGFEIEKYKKEKFFYLILLTRIIVHLTVVVIALTIAFGFAISQ